MTASSSPATFTNQVGPANPEQVNLRGVAFAAARSLDSLNASILRQRAALTQLGFSQFDSEPPVDSSEVEMLDKELSAGLSLLNALNVLNTRILSRAFQLQRLTELLEAQLDSPAPSCAPATPVR